MVVATTANLAHIQNMGGYKRQVSGDDHGQLHLFQGEVMAEIRADHDQTDPEDHAGEDFDLFVLPVSGHDGEKSEGDDGAAQPDMGFVAVEKLESEKRQNRYKKRHCQAMNQAEYRGGDAQIIEREHGPGKTALVMSMFA